MTGPRTDDTGDFPVENWSDTVEEAVEEAAGRSARRQEVAAKLRPNNRHRLFRGSLIALGLVLAWDVYVLTRPAPGLSQAREEQELQEMVGYVAEEAEAFRAQENRLPSKIEMAQAMFDGMTYDTDGSVFTITARLEGSTIRYESTVPLSEWLTSGTEGR